MLKMQTMHFPGWEWHQQPYTTCSVHSDDAAAWHAFHSQVQQPLAGHYSAAQKIETRTVTEQSQLSAYRDGWVLAWLQPEHLGRAVCVVLPRGPLPESLLLGGHLQEQHVEE